MPAERPAKSLLTAPTLGETHPDSSAGNGVCAGTALGVPGAGGPVRRSSLRSDCRSPARAAGTGKSGSSASRCQDTLAFKPELGPISPGAGEHQPHVIRHRRLSERKSVTAVTQPVGRCLCADRAAPAPAACWKPLLPGCAEQKSGGEEKRKALFACALSPAPAQTLGVTSPGRDSTRVISVQEQ